MSFHCVESKEQFCAFLHRMNIIELLGVFHFRWKKGTMMWLTGKRVLGEQWFEVANQEARHLTSALYPTSLH